MEYERALPIAESVKESFLPYCNRIEIAGSIRRQAPHVGDIEIVCIPRVITYSDLFGDSVIQRHFGFAKTALDVGLIARGTPGSSRYFQIKVKTGDNQLPSFIDVDVFVATHENWGLIYAIRTGSKDFAHYALACGWSARGYTSVDGMLHDPSGKPIPVREESDLFEIAGTVWIPPEKRNIEVN